MLVAGREFSDEILERIRNRARDDDNLTRSGLSREVGAVTLDSSPMSAPAMNALSPAPVRMTPRIAESPRASSNAVCKSSHVLRFKAFRTFGRLSVTYAMAPFFS